MTDYLVVHDDTNAVVGIGSARRITVAGETVYPVHDTLTLNRELILRGATVTIVGGEVSAISYPTTIDRDAEKLIGRVQAVVEEVFYNNRRIPITGQVAREAMEATESWAVHLGGAGYRVAHNSITGLTLTADAQEAAVAQLENMPAATKIWHGVMAAATGNNNVRDRWRSFSYAENASIYADCLNADATPRTIDGTADIIIPGGFPAGFNPHAIT